MAPAGRHSADLSACSIQQAFCRSGTPPDDCTYAWNIWPVSRVSWRCGQSRRLSRFAKWFSACH